MDRVRTPASSTAIDPLSAEDPEALRVLASRSFENAYEGVPTWDIGRPQAAVTRLVEAGLVAGSVLDVGCGTGDAAIYLAGLGHPVLGVDFSSRAIEKARGRPGAGENDTLSGGRHDPEFLVWDGLRLAELGRAFDTILDVGCFHCLQEADRAAYAASLRAVVTEGGRCHLLCWSDENPFGRGPGGVSRTAIRRAFRTGWVVERIDRDVLETRLPEGRVHAWLARLRPR